MKPIKLRKYQIGAISTYAVTDAAAGSGGGPAPIVSASCNGRTNTRTIATCYVGVRFDSNTNEYEQLNNGNWNTTSEGVWLDQGSGADVWVQFNRTGGNQTNWGNRTSGVRYNMASTLDYTMNDSNPTAGSSKTITGTFAFYDAASGGTNLQTTSSATWSCAYTEACPLCCFTPYTLITMADGSRKAIIDIEVGEEILVANGIEEVISILIRENRPMYKLIFEDSRTLELSCDHPVYVEGKGYCSVAPQEEYKSIGASNQLEKGDYVETEGSILIKLVDIQPLDFTDKVYTLGNSHFFAEGVRVG